MEAKVRQEEALRSAVGYMNEQASHMSTQQQQQALALVPVAQGSQEVHSGEYMHPQRLEAERIAAAEAEARRGQLLQSAAAHAKACACKCVCCMLRARVCVCVCSACRESCAFWEP